MKQTKRGGASLRRIWESVRLQLKVIRASVDDVDARMEILELEFDNADERREKDKREILRAVHRSRTVSVCAVGVLVAVLLLRTSAPAERAAPPVLPEPVGPTAREVHEGVRSGAAGGAASVAASLIHRASPMPAGGVPGQRRAPCPEGAEAIKNEWCWNRWTLTPEQVRGGACDDPQFYEPSEGWCVAHRAAYRPVYAPVRRKNAEKQ